MPEATPQQPITSAGLHGSEGSIVAGRDVTASSTQHIKAEQLFVLPREAYAAIPQDAGASGVSNVASGLFVGRENELEALEAAFARPGRVVVHAVHGLGGVGKSALAARWAQRRPESVRWWVTADSVAGAEAGLAALARALQPTLTGLPAPLQTERAIAWLASNDGWLLVLDNIEEPAHIRPLLDRLPRGRVLVTTRRATGWHHDATTIRLGVLASDDALALFIRVLTHHGSQDTAGAEALCAELGHLALAVEQAAAYCAETGTSPHTYLDMLSQWPATMFAQGAEGGDSERTIARIWHITLNRLTARTPLAGDLLRVLAWYGPDRIPRDLLGSLAEPPALATGIGRLIAYSMITDNYDGTLTVHRLVQALARTPDPDDPHRTPSLIDHAREQAIGNLAAAVPESWSAPATWPTWRTLLPHVEALAEHTTHDTASVGRLLDAAASFVNDQGQPTRAVKLFQRALAATTQVNGEDHPDTLACSNNLAGAYHMAGDHARAISMYEQTLTSNVRALGEDHPHTLTSHNNLAHAYHLAGDLARAIPMHEQNLANRIRILGEDHPDTLGSRNNLAGAYESAGDLARAIPMYEKTLNDRIHILGEDHPDTLTSGNNLAGAYESAGDLARAIPMYEKTLTSSVHALGENHPHSLMCHNNLAYAYHAAGDHARAIPMHEKTLTSSLQALGENHPYTLTSRSNLAYALQSVGDLARAIPMHERTLNDRIHILGEDHPDTLTSRSNLAGAYETAGDLARAIPMHERTLNDRIHILGEDHPDTLTSRSNLAHAYWVARRRLEAIVLFRGTLKGMRQILGVDHPQTRATYERLALVLQKHAVDGVKDLERGNGTSRLGLAEEAC